MLLIAIAFLLAGHKILFQDFCESAGFEVICASDNFNNENFIPAQGNSFSYEGLRSKISGDILSESSFSSQNNFADENEETERKILENEKSKEGGSPECKKDCNLKNQRQIIDRRPTILKEFNSKEGECMIKGCFDLKNASVGWSGLELVSVNGKTAICGTEGSRAALRGCRVVMSCRVPLFETHGSCVLLENITLQSSNPLSNEISPLFSLKGTINKASYKSLLSVRFSCFSSFCVSSAPFLASPLIESISLADLIFFNISTKPSDCSSPTASIYKTQCFMQSCSFSSVCDVYDGGIVPSLNNPLASLTASNTSFVGCCRTRNVEHIGTEEEKKQPGRINETDNGANTFTWCEWIGSNTTGTYLVIEDGQSCGGAIYMYGHPNGELFVSHCKFNDCTAHYDGGGILCASVKSFKIENNTFNSCTTEVNVGGAICALSITACVRIRGCEFEKCKAKTHGGGLYLENFLILGTGCIEAEDGEGKSACVFDCSFSSCSIDSKWGGGMNCRNVPVQFKMRSIQFISCKASSYGGGLHLSPNQSSSQSDSYYCYFLFFTECECRTASTPYGHDVHFEDYFDVYSASNPFYECYTTNTNDTRVCYACNYSNASDWTYDQTTKKDWLKRGIVNRFVAVSGGNEEDLCGIDESSACRTIGVAVSRSVMQLSLSVTLMKGNYASETETINIGEKKISVIGTGIDKSSIGTGALSAPSSSGALFSMTEGYLRMKYLNVDCNSTADSSPSVVVVSDGSGTLSLEDVVITTSVSSGNVISSSVFVVSLSQLSMADVEIINMNVSKPLFSEPDLSSSFSSSSSTLFLQAAVSEESMLANVKVTNVKLTEGDGVVVTKSVAEGETFVVKNVTIEDCECVDGSGGGIKIDLSSSSSKLRAGISSTPEGETTKFNRCKCSGYGGGIMLYLDENSFDFSICSVNFEGCTAKSGGNYLFVNGSELAIGTISTTNLNVQRNAIAFNELVGFDRSDPTLGLFPLNVYLDEIEGSAHVGKAKENGLGGCNSLFCGLDYYPCATITHAAKVRYPEANKNIELDSGFELAEEVAMIGEYEWKVFCITKGMKVSVKIPDNLESEFLIEVQSACKMENISFSIPTDLEGVTSLISTNSTLLTLTDCSVCCSSENTEGDAIGCSFVRAIGRKLKMEGFVIEESLMFGVHSLVEFASGVDAVVCVGCNVSNVEKRNGDGGWMDGEVGAERDEGKNGIIVIEGCNIKGCSCCGRGGGIHASVKGEGSVVVNGTSVIDGCEANGLGERKGRGGGMMVEMGSRDCGLKIEGGVKFSVDADNIAMFGKDVFVSCNSGILLETKVNATSFALFDASAIPTDVLELSGTENGNEDEVIPLFVYLCSMGSKLIVDGSGEWSLDHSRCGFEKFGCLTIDYCISERANISIHIIEVVSESSIKSEVKVASCDVCLSGKIESVEEEKMRVEVSDEGSANQERFIECTSSLSVSYITFSVDSPLKNARKALIYSSLSTLTIANCSISFAEEALTNGMIGYSIIDKKGGKLIVDGFVIEEEVMMTMNGISPIMMKNGTELEMRNIGVSGVEVAGGSGGGCLNVEINEMGNANIEGCNLSSTCSGGSGMKGGGVMISVGERGSLEMKNMKFDGCGVPSTDKEEGGRGIGGGMFVRFAEEMGSTVLEGMIFEGCNAWKGKNVFVSGWDLSEIMPNEQLKWEITEEKLDLLDELCGWERKTAGEGYVIPLVVYLWSNWSGNGFVSKEKGGDFSGCGYSEAPCSSIDRLISLRYSTLEEGETHIHIIGSGLLSHPISFSFSFISSSILESPKVVIEGTKKGTALIISDEDENDLNDCSMISSNVSLSFVNVSFTKPTITTHHEVFIESSGTNACLTVVDCSFGSLTGLTETAGYCLMRVNGGNILIQRCAVNGINELKGFIAFTPEVLNVIVEDVKITNIGVIERSLMTIIENDHSNGIAECLKEKGRGNREIAISSPQMIVNISTFENITNEGNGACVVNVRCAESGIRCELEGCSMTNCKSERSEEGGGMKACVKSEGNGLKIKGCSLVMCMCSAAKGKGGGLMVDGVDQKADFAETGIMGLGLRMESVRFIMNDAFVGRDVFIKCYSIEDQINETLFSLDFTQDSLKSENSICGSDLRGKINQNLIPFVSIYCGVQAFVSGEGVDGRQCGAQNSPCSSVNCAVDHIQEGVMNAILIDGEGTVTKECVIGDLVVNSLKKAQAIVRLNSKVEKSSDKDCIMEFINECSVERCSFQFEETFESTHNCLMKVKNGSMEIQKCEFCSTETELKVNSSIVNVERGELRIFDSAFMNLHSSASLLSFCEESKVEVVETIITNIECERDVVVVGGKAKVEMKEIAANNISLMKGGSSMKIEGAEKDVSVLNCSFGKCTNSKDKGSMVQIREGRAVRIEACAFDGEGNGEGREETNGKMNRKEICGWNGSLVDVENSKVEMKETAIKNSKAGGLWVSGGSLAIENGKFENNNPSIEGYPSVRRNAICTGNGELNVVSLKGGDGMEKNTSLWILDEGCKLGGIAAERASPFFIPVLEDVKNATQPSGELELIIHGKLLLPCNLSVKISMKEGDEEEIVRKGIDEEDCVSENEVHSTISLELLKVMENKAEASMCIQFGKSNLPSFTTEFILKNRSETRGSGNDKLVEGRKEGKSSWELIAIIMTIVLSIVLIVAVAFIVRWRKAKKRAKELEVIVKDTIRKDPKAFEMVTMEMSPEEQWKRVEREAEKKNEEFSKKRVYEKSLVHSESSQYLLAESGSTEYILRRDSDEIPEWALEKVEEDEDDDEIRKRTPSPSISSTSTISTTDTDTTFVQIEDLCPTTSSMSNLVDAMACSSPHEKLIVDLRDSLFMLLHGRNEKKEMTIGTLQERELMAAQILFWVANLALHSFDEMEVPLSSLANLSPHIVLFSEHMVICIVMHSDFSSDDDSDSSSISSSTIITSSSDDSTINKNGRGSPPPSSAFEEEDDFKKECLRWKAPELLNGAKTHATKKTVAFSIGMMLWESLTLQIPFGEYEAVVAGDKIVRGERPDTSKTIETSYCEVIKECLSVDRKERPTLVGLKREFIGHFPAGTVMLTVSDAIDYEAVSFVEDQRLSTGQMMSSEQ
ncbi:uncharacterized protein MONOS_10694 [Monocercomonoides exilis]|uniref:uncharacterized protein n=1 Tax=Monocercomonoides exilis TaxID=2049356 RepID=UPI00355A00E6|nr:hypothetical protein MONOS_10694 [Monocercomonoides exilis]|eukprot:MONOS_10694.1-p1 / transcript=MONOS_10694.1 / gene=MONOS_10694 / organism=Monocercomonoides_exilis_PA203 / gene_product=unspecified product / transcript_product=unspecified product / location=Mono_scaffold00496:1126-10410(-) / protein_length=3094 / sequence_SO=supercontig / SO=protein_coding / is_pseudo=false